MTVPTQRPSLTPVRRPSRTLRATLAGAAALLLLAAACGDDDDETSTGSGGDGGGGDTLSITTPTDGAEVGDSFDVELDSNVEFDEPDTGEHHVHLYYDGETAEGDYDLVYGNSFTVERDLGEGEHMIEAVIANADHSLTETRTEISVTVGAGAGSGDEEDTDSGGGSGGDDGGYGY